MMSSPFPLTPAHSLTRDDVVDYLVGLLNDGHTVTRGGSEKAFSLRLDDDQRILIWLEHPGEAWQVEYENLGIRELVGKAGTLAQLEKAISKAAARGGVQWPCRPTTGRLSATTPATNYGTISHLVGSSKVEAVFDPYLENSSLTEIINILSFGSGVVSNGVRLLGSTKKTQGPVPRLSKAGVDAWLTQQGITGEARVFPDSADNHRRFMLLSGGQCLILGPSFNAIHKNEATHVEQDTADRAFFDSMWATATGL